MKITLSQLIAIISASLLSLTANGQVNEAHTQAHETAMTHHNNAVEMHNTMMESNNKVLLYYEEENLIDNRMSISALRKMRSPSKYKLIPLKEREIELSGGAGEETEISFTGGYLAMNISSSKESSYRVYVNGYPAGKVKVAQGDSFVVLAGGLTKKEHKLKLKKIDDGNSCSAVIKSLEVSRGARASW